MERSSASWCLVFSSKRESSHMIKIVLCASAVAVFCMIVACATLLFLALIDDGWRGVRSMFQSIVEDYRLSIGIMVVISIAMIPLVYYSSKRAEARARHECICDCEACKKNAEKLEEVLKLVQEKLPEAK